MRISDTGACLLQNSELSVEVRPAEGGRIASLKSLRSGLEFLTQPHRSGQYPQASLDTRFQDGPCAGIEECLPTVGPSGPATEGGPAPDHGDFWQLPWKVLTTGEAYVTLAAAGFSRPLRFSKQISLGKNSLRAAYSVTNIGSTRQSFLYACHPLFAISAGDRVLLPSEIRELRLDYSKEDRLGLPGSRITWPITQSGVRLDLTGSPQAGRAEMLYSSQLHRGVCGIYREASTQVLEISFDPERLPYLGLWLCYGGWPGDGIGPLQYAVALEPTTSGCNTLAEAQQTNTDISLEVGQAYDWVIQFSVKEPGHLSQELCLSHST
jgi:galactose mutarotase-like enzyme